MQSKIQIRTNPSQQTHAQHGIVNEKSVGEQEQKMRMSARAARTLPHLNSYSHLLGVCIASFFCWLSTRFNIENGTNAHKKLINHWCMEIEQTFGIMHLWRKKL